MYEDIKDCHLCRICKSPDVTINITDEIVENGERVSLESKSYCKEHETVATAKHVDGKE